MILSYNGPGLIVYGVAYYELDPPYICTYKKVNENPAINSNDMNLNSTFNIMTDLSVGGFHDSDTYE